MRAVFEAVARNGLRGGILILAVLLLRLLLRRTPRRVVLLFWGMVGLRLLIPLRLTAFFGLLPGQRAAAILLAPARSGVPVPEAAASAAGASAFDWLSVLPWVWLAVAAGLLVPALARSLRLRRRLSDAVLSENDAWRSDRISTPFAFGLLRPRIYLPAGLPEEDLPWVLAHERVHIRRGDTCKKALGLLLLAVYWFQPLCWLGWRAFCRDLELACDERATEGLTLTERKAYALALLRCSAPAGALGAAGFGEQPIRVRIRSILRRRSQPRWVSLLLGAVCTMVLICLCFESPASAQSRAISSTAFQNSASESAVPEDDASDRDHTAPGTRDSDLPEHADENPEASLAENAIHWDFSGEQFSYEAPGSYHTVVHSNSESERFSVHESASSDGQNVTITLRDVGDPQSLNMAERSWEALEQSAACFGWHTEDEGYMIYWEIETTP